MILKACAYKPGLFALVMVGQAFSALSKLGFNNKKVLPNLIRSKLGSLGFSNFVSVRINCSESLIKGLHFSVAYKTCIDLVPVGRIKICLYYWFYVLQLRIRIELSHNAPSNQRC